jgi:hypothetical protein
MSLSASATVSFVQITASAYEYTITLTDTGTTPIGTFWFSWVPGAGFLPNLPSFSSPDGWSASLTDAVPPANGYSIEWIAGSASAALQPGQSLSDFVFTSTTAPSTLFGNSTIHAPTPVTTSVVYSGAPFSDAGFTLVATDAPISNDNVFVSISADNAVQEEGNSGSTAFTFVVTRDGGTNLTQSVSYAVTGTGTAPADAADFVGNHLPTGTVTFAPGETSKTVTVAVAGDATVEQNEYFAVTLSNPSSGLAIDTAVASGTIVNDDTAPPAVVNNDAYISLQGSGALTVSAANGLLFNDVSATALTASLVTGPAHGTLQLAPNGSFVYTPDAGFTGVDGIAYHATNGDTSGDASALFFVVPVQVGTATTLNLLALSPGEQIAATYTAFFGRGADAAGFVFWVNEFAKGLAAQGPSALFANIASSFGVSAEAKALYPFLANPFEATDQQIGTFLDSVYNNLFNRPSDAGGLAYWTRQIKATLAAGQFVGSVLVNIISGAQDTAVGHDITTLMGKVAVNLDYVVEQRQHDTPWSAEVDGANATALLHGVSNQPQTVLVGMAQAHALVLGDIH